MMWFRSDPLPDAGMMKHRDAEKPECREAGMPSSRDAETTGCRDGIGTATKVPLFSHENGVSAERMALCAINLEKFVRSMKSSSKIMA